MKGLGWRPCLDKSNSSQHGLTSCGNASWSARWKLLETLLHSTFQGAATAAPVLGVQGRAETAEATVSDQVGKDTCHSQGLDLKCWKLLRS